MSDIEQPQTTPLAQGLVRELRHTESVADAWKAETMRLREAVRTPLASTLSHEAALERLRQINVLSYGSST